MEELFDLTGKTALVTGGTHGIGLAIGIILAALGIFGATRAAANKVGIALTASGVRAYTATANLVIGVKVAASYCVNLYNLIRIPIGRIAAQAIPTGRIAAQRINAARINYWRRIRSCFP